jgi:hypothetical protein
MTFDEALELAKQGHRLVRRSNQYDTLVVVHDRPLIQLGAYCANMPPSDADHEATDWEEKPIDNSLDGGD